MEVEKPRCGECLHFDPNDVAGLPVGTEILEGEEVNKGFCRVNGGLIFGRLNDHTPCKQPPGFFQPRFITENPLTTL